MRITRFRCLFLALLLVVPTNGLAMMSARTVEILLSSTSEQQEEETHQHATRPSRPARKRSKLKRLHIPRVSRTLHAGMTRRRPTIEPGAPVHGHRLSNGLMAPLLT
ncbi:MAG: hypothetical protein ACF8PG_10680 [Maioricimonas sp. JB045]|uniref:hypothetical protein n=1 Tax=Maioricimonas sp. JC845 TaxID=3232138 RepID=UPI0034595F24